MLLAEGQLSCNLFSYVLKAFLPTFSLKLCMATCTNKKHEKKKDGISCTVSPAAIFINKRLALGAINSNLVLVNSYSPTCCISLYNLQRREAAFKCGAVILDTGNLLLCLLLWYSVDNTPP